MMIPKVEECYKIMSRMDMPDHIVAHSIQVCRLATVLSGFLQRENILLDINLIRAAAMLHDITKNRSFKTGENHASTGAEFITDLGYPEIGRIISQHVQLNEYSDTLSTPREEEIVNYADKRVIHDSVGTLSERRSYILERYGKDAAHKELIYRMFDKTFLLEKRLFQFLPISAEELSAYVIPSDCFKELEAYRQVTRSGHAEDFSGMRKIV